MRATLCVLPCCESAALHGPAWPERPLPHPAWPRRFADFSDLPSDADDPLPLNPSDALLGSYEDGTPINVFS